MQEKIKNRDAEKGAVKKMPIKTFDNDWWREHDMEVQAIVNVMICNAIRDVNAFLQWLNYMHPEKTMGSFVFNREKARLEKEINMQVRRYWYTKAWHRHVEGRRKQIEMRVKERLMLSVSMGGTTSRAFFFCQF